MLGTERGWGSSTYIYIYIHEGHLILNVRQYTFSKGKTLPETIEQKH